MASTPFQDFPATTNSQWLIGQVILFGVGPSEAQQDKNRPRNTVKAIQGSKKKIAKKRWIALAWSWCPWCGMVSMVSIVLSHVAIIASRWVIRPGTPSPRTVRSAHSGTRRSQRMHMCSPKKHIFLVFCLMRIINQHQIPWCNRWEGWKKWSYFVMIMTSMKQLKCDWTIFGPKVCRYPSTWLELAMYALLHS